MGRKENMLRNALLSFLEYGFPFVVSHVMVGGDKVLQIWF